MNNLFRRRRSRDRRTIVRAEIEHRRLLRMSRSLCTRHYYLLH
jgi:hypothetical protein